MGSAKGQQKKNKARMERFEELKNSNNVMKRLKSIFHLAR